ncbi:hypothetical protein HAX54_003319, partial [Datura stramonium]|nr:hypothetical protein [Datura stramonium]
MSCVWSIRSRAPSIPHTCSCAIPTAAGGTCEPQVQTQGVKPRINGRTPIKVDQRKNAKGMQKGKT